MLIGIHELICLVSVSYLLLFTLFLVTTKKGKQLSNRFLALFLFSKCMGIVNYLLYRLDIQNPHVYFILVPFAFLWGPSLLFYIKSKVYKNFLLLRSHIFHLVPFAAASIYFILVYHTRGLEHKIEILNQARTSGSAAQDIFIVVLHLTIACYLYVCVRTLRRYKNHLRNIYSNLTKSSFSWLQKVLVGFILIWILDVFAYVLVHLSISDSVIRSVTLALTFVFVNLVVFLGLREPDIFNGVEHKRRYQLSPLTNEEKQKYLEQLQEYVRREKPYLDPDLTVDKLAKRVRISSRYMSQVINESLGLNFYDFINGYRVEAAKALITDETAKQRTIMELLLDAGFNTKSVFNRVFKKHTGKTPTEFKKDKESTFSRKRTT